MNHFLTNFALVLAVGLGGSVCGVAPVLLAVWAGKKFGRAGFYAACAAVVLVGSAIIAAEVP